MPSLSELHGRILTSSGWINGTLTIDPEGRIQSITKSIKTVHEDRILLPGFIDLHVHGGAGSDVMQGGEHLQTIAAIHARHGTTSMLATTVTAPLPELEQVLTQIAAQIGVRPAATSRLLGVHLEGPFINPEKLGAQPDFACIAVHEQIQTLCKLAPVRVVTIAPELPDHISIIKDLRQQGIRVQIGHSAGSYEDGVHAMQAGASSFTHLFNAMSGLHHREPGMVGAALAHAEFAEIIPDLLHVHPGAIRAALRAIPHLYCVTDSTAAAGMPDGRYMLGSHQVSKCMGGVRLADGTLAGSALTMDLALRNLVSIGLSIEDASHRLSRNPARYLGLTERGSLEAEAWADIVELDANLQLINVYIEGEKIVIHDV